MWRGTSSRCISAEWSSVGLRVVKQAYKCASDRSGEYRVFRAPPWRSHAPFTSFLSAGRTNGCGGERRGTFLWDSPPAGTAFHQAAPVKSAMVHPVAETCLRAHRCGFYRCVVARYQWKFINAPVRTCGMRDLRPDWPERPAAFCREVAVVHENHVTLPGSTTSEPQFALQNRFEALY